MNKKINAWRKMQIKHIFSGFNFSIFVFQNYEYLPKFVLKTKHLCTCSRKIEFWRINFSYVWVKFISQPPRKQNCVSNARNLHRPPFRRNLFQAIRFTQRDPTSAGSNQVLLRAALCKWKSLLDIFFKIYFVNEFWRNTIHK